MSVCVCVCVCVGGARENREWPSKQRNDLWPVTPTPERDKEIPRSVTLRARLLITSPARAISFLNATDWISDGSDAADLLSDTRAVSIACAQQDLI